MSDIHDIKVVVKNYEKQSTEAVNAALNTAWVEFEQKNPGFVFQKWKKSKVYDSGSVTFVLRFAKRKIILPTS